MREIKMGSIRAIDRAIDVLQVFDNENKFFSLDEIAKKTNLPISTVYRILCTLEKRRLIQYDQKKSAYHLGLKLVEFGLLSSSIFNIQQLAEEELIEFQRKTKQTVIMAVKLEDEILYVFSKENEQGLKFSSTVGQRRPITYGLLGPILLAFSPQSQIDRVLSFPIPAQTPFTIIDKNKWYQKLENIRNEKSYIDINFTTIGVAGIGAPIFGVDQNVTAALGVLGPSVQMEDKLEECKTQMLETIDKISRKMRISE